MKQILQFDFAFGIVEKRRNNTVKEIVLILLNLASVFVFVVYPPQTASLALLAAMQTVDLLLLGLSFMLRKKEQ